MLPIETQQNDQLVSELLYGKAHRLYGSGLDDASLIQLAKTEFADRAFCIVRNWMIVDIMLPAGEQEEVFAAEQYSVVLFAHDITYDSQAIQCGHAPFVTGYANDFFGCFFDDGMKIFVLAGLGARRYAAKPALIALRQAMAGKEAGG